MGRVPDVAARGRGPTGRKGYNLGAGGAARAIAVELALAGAAEIMIVNRNLERGGKTCAYRECFDVDDCAPGAMDRLL
jgi:shikimate 5-dehydrogenase